MSEVCIGIIGTGKIAGKFAEAVNRAEGARLYGVASRTFSRARTFAEKYNTTVWYGSYDELLKDDKVELIYVATPHVFHKENTMSALNAGKGVLCEKPFALSARDAAEMIALAEEKGLFLAEAMWTRFFPAVKKVKEILESGVLGEIVTFQADLSYSFPFDSESRIYNKSLGGGALLDLGIYPLSIMHYFLGVPQNMQARSVFCDTGVDSSTSILCSYESGAQALLSCSVSTQTPGEAVISCTKGWIRLNAPFHHPNSISIFHNGENHYSFPYEGYGYEYEVESAVRSFREGKTEDSHMTHKDTQEVMELLDRVRELTGLHYE